MVKTVSGSVASWPATGNVTTRPLPVKELRQETNPDTREIRLVWEPHPESQQDAFKVGPYGDQPRHQGDQARSGSPTRSHSRMLLR